MTSPHTGDTLGSAGPTSPSKHLKSRSRFQPKKKQQDGGNGWSKLSTNHSMKRRDGGAWASAWALSLMIIRMSMRKIMTMSITMTITTITIQWLSDNKANKAHFKQVARKISNCYIVLSAALLFGQFSSSPTSWVGLWVMAVMLSLPKDKQAITPPL